MRVLSSFFDFSNLVAARIIFVHILLHREQKISKVSSASPDQNIKKVGYDLHYRIVFSFHQAYFRLPVSLIGTSGFRKTVYFRFDFGNGSRKVYGAEAEGQLYTPSKFHGNRFTGLGGVNMGHLKYNGS